MYALVAFFAMWRLRAVRILFRPTGRRRWLFYVLATAAGLLTHYFSIFLMPFKAWLAGLGPDRRTGGRCFCAWSPGPARGRHPRCICPQLPLALRRQPPMPTRTCSRLPTGFLGRSWMAYTASGLALASSGLAFAGRRADRGRRVLWFRARVTSGGRAGCCTLRAGQCPLVLYFLVLQSQPSLSRAI